MILLITSLVVALTVLAAILYFCRCSKNEKQIESVENSLMLKNKKIEQLEKELQKYREDALAYECTLQNYEQRIVEVSDTATEKTLAKPHTAILQLQNELRPYVKYDKENNRVSMTILKPIKEDE